jgi:hypothetical protein
MVGQIRLGKVNVLGKIVSSSKLSVYKFTDAELGELKTEFGSYDTSGDGRYVTIRDSAAATLQSMFLPG